MPVEITAVGNVEAISTVSIRPQVSGQLLDVHFKEGDFVHKGQLLLTLDSRPFQAQVNQANGAIVRDQAQIAQAEANLARDSAQEKYAQAEAQRNSALMEKGLIPRETLEQTAAQADAPLGATERARVVSTTARLLDSLYVDRRLAREMSAWLRDGLRIGRWDRLGSASAFADTVTAQLRAISRS